MEYEGFDIEYNELRNKDKALALAKLTDYCKTNNKSDIFTKQFCHLIQQLEGIKSSLEKSEIYEKHFSEKIKNHSQLFSHWYADSVAEGYTEHYSKVFAKYYEIADNEGKTNGYKYNFADKIADYVTNQFVSSHDYENDDNFKEAYKNIVDELGQKQFK